MEKVSCTNKEMNKLLLHMVQEKRKTLDTIKKHKHKWLGHMLISRGRILHDILEKRTLGKKIIQMVNNLIKKTAFTLILR